MSREEFYKKYGDVEVVFSYYYKYAFTFAGELPNGFRIFCKTGGNSDDIYREEVAVGVKSKIRDLEPYAGGLWDGGIKIESFYDY